MDPFLCRPFAHAITLLAPSVPSEYKDGVVEAESVDGIFLLSGGVIAELGDPAAP